MQKIVQKAGDQLQARWPFESPFHIPFPAQLFKTGYLIIEAPFLPGAWVMRFCTDDDWHVSPFHDFVREGAFDLGARSILLHIAEVEGTPALEVGEAAYQDIADEDPSIRGHIRHEEYLEQLLRTYMCMCMSNHNSPSVKHPDSLVDRLKHGGLHERPSDCWVYMWTQI